MCVTRHHAHLEPHLRACASEEQSLSEGFSEMKRSRATNLTTAELINQVNPVRAGDSGHFIGAHGATFTQLDSRIHTTAHFSQGKPGNSRRCHTDQLSTRNAASWNLDCKRGVRDVGTRTDLAELFLNTRNQASSALRLELLVCWVVLLPRPPPPTIAASVFQVTCEQLVQVTRLLGPQIDPLAGSVELTRKERRVAARRWRHQPWITTSLETASF